MPIRYHASSSVFHLWNDTFSEIFCILKNGQLGQLYYGARLNDREDFDHLLVHCRRDMSAFFFADDPTFSMDTILQVYPVSGSGDLRRPACEVIMPCGARSARFSYVSHTVTPGKPRLEGLPATYTETDDEAETLTVLLTDELLSLDLELSFTVFAALPMLARNARFSSRNPEPVRLTRAMSLSLDLPDSDYEMVELAGVWARERAPKACKLREGLQSVYSLRGHSSHEFNPFLMLRRPGANEDQGEVIGAALVYSGNFLAQVEVDNYQTARMIMGIHPEGFEWTLNQGDSFQTPEAILAYTPCGMNALSQAFHKLFRTRLARGYWRDRARPILINNWEATYFDFNEEKLLKIASKAAELGVELFVLDDGWFGCRNDARSSLGDWFPSKEKLPDGLKSLGEKINALGMRFGLWFEPEMVSPNSDLYRAHPDWALTVPGRSPSLGRNQLVLDFSRPEVVDAIARQMEKILSEAPISYVKWDMNRSITDAYTREGRQGEFYHRHILGFYSLYERLTSRFPKVLFESCASGGARFDPGMLYYAPQAWTSDDTDAVERIKVQYGTSYAYPLSSMGSHVSASPNHQVFRDTPLKTRADVAYFGTFGYELDLNKLSSEEQAEITKQICFMKSHQDLIREGDFYRLLSPFEGSEAAWMVVSPDKKRALAGYYRILEPVNGALRTLKLRGLDPNMQYRVRDTAYPARCEKYLSYGDELMQFGLDINDTGTGVVTPDIRQGDYQSRLFEIEAE